MTPNREKISATIRALRAKTVANGCTEAEAVAAAEMLAKLLAKHNMTLDEAELRASPFSRHTEEHADWVGERLWKIADGAAHLTSARYWVSPPGVHPIKIHFFGFDHEVEIARYMLEVCAGAMRREEARVISSGRRLVTKAKQRRAVAPFLDGMADRLRERIRALKPAAPTGTGLVVLHDALVVQAMADAGLKMKDQAARPSRTREDSYFSGRLAADRVALNQAIRSGNIPSGLLR